MSADEIVFRSPASVLQASSVALVGASERGKWQRLIYDNLREYGYAGRVFLVNPRQARSLRRALLSVAARAAASRSIMPW